MLGPRNRLLLWVTVVVLPFSVLGALAPGAKGLSLAAIGALAGLALADALGARSRLAGISLDLPAVARMSKDRESKLEVRIRNQRQRPRTLRLALGLPREIVSAQEDAFVALPPDNEWSRVAWTCRPNRRGSYRLRTAHLETSSPLGFWAVRKHLAVNSELRVYPNLLKERRDLAALFLHRGSLGLHSQRQVGKGRDFERLREYLPGDSFDEVHWKATAKRGRPITKVFQLERTQEVYVVVDASRLSARAAAPVPGRGLAAEQQGDLFGLVAFTDRIESFVRAKNGKAHYSACRDALYRLEPRGVTPDFQELCTFLRLRLRRRALLVVLTALDDPVVAQSFVSNMDLVRRQHLVLVNMLQPPRVGPLFSNPAADSVDDLYEHLGGHLLWQKLRELEKVLQRRGVHFSLLKNERLSAQLVSQYLNVKQRQLL